MSGSTVRVSEATEESVARLESRKSLPGLGAERLGDDAAASFADGRTPDNQASMVRWPPSAMLALFFFFFCFCFWLLFLKQRLYRDFVT